MRILLIERSAQGIEIATCPSPPTAEFASEARGKRSIRAVARAERNCSQKPPILKETHVRVSSKGFRG